MIDSELTSNRYNNIWLCNRSLDGEILQLQNGGRPCDVAQSYISSGVSYLSHSGHCSFVGYVRPGIGSVLVALYLYPPMMY